MSQTGLVAHLMIYNNCFMATISQDSHVSYTVTLKWELSWQTGSFRNLGQDKIANLIYTGEREKKSKRINVLKVSISLSKTMISYEKAHFQSIGTLRSFINNVLPKLKINFL